MIDAENWFETQWGVRLPNGKMAMTMTGHAWTWPTREDAERAMVFFRAYSEQLGVEDWHGEVVRRLTTPWIGEDDNAELMVAELSRWLEQQTGGAQ